jgi:hypothetical protein
MLIKYASHRYKNILRCMSTEKVKYCITHHSVFLKALKNVQEISLEPRARNMKELNCGIKSSGRKIV